LWACATSGTINTLFCEQNLSSASPFNIVSDELTLKNFTKEEIAILYHQHSDEKGQKTDDAAIDKIHYYTQGQPWLVNAMDGRLPKKF
jgi:hypothetical protein